ncbi:MAG: hypothetical protein IT566_16300 [Rhodospirillaceae bacterium]|nr:hypothetical protein [Rhodospirillaceae bacterium]
MKARVGFAHHHHRETVPSPLMIAASSAVYVGGAVGVGFFDRGFLLMAWLMTVFLAVAVYLTLDSHGRLINAYTLFFTGVIAVSAAGYFLT